MKKVMIATGLVIAAFLAQSSGEMGNVAQAGGIDRDPTGVLNPRESIKFQDGSVFTNTCDAPMEVKYCPGKGEICKVTVDVKGMKVTYEEEKDPDKNAVQVFLFGVQVL